MEANKIKRLDPVVVNRIAAGEVIQRPANAIKEMLENSLDAKATNISIAVTSGGLKSFQIQDNGTGIRKDDLEIVCERFTTSKLSKFSDLNSIQTYGFRGEALASISHVAHLTLQTKTQNEKCAYKAQYIDGKLKSPPKPCAGNQGTLITVDDLFYNMATRRNTLKNASEEYQKIYDVVSKYAIHNCHVGFSMRKHGDCNSSDLKTNSNSNFVDNIRLIYGNDVAKELLHLKFVDDVFKVQVQGYITNVNYTTKKPTFILFINHRLVESSSLKKSLDLVYSTYLPKGAHPFIYLSLIISPENIDVNVHPTKHEVKFLNEDEIIDKIKSEVETKLLGCNESRAFYTKCRAPNNSNNKSKETEDGKTSIHDKYLIRTDMNEQKLEKFFGNISNYQAKSLATLITNRKKDHRVQVKLQSVLQLRKHIEDNCDLKLRQLFSQHKFVGSIDDQLSLIQHDTKLFLCQNSTLANELFNQFMLYDFQNFDQIRFNEPLPICDLVKLALELPEVSYNQSKDGDVEFIANSCKQILWENSEMLKTYFEFEVDDKGYLLGIPLLLDGYIPDLTGLPLYLLRLATEVNWDEEKECFEMFARETAKFYSNINTDDSLDLIQNSTINNNGWKWSIEHIFYPALKKFIIPSNSLQENGLIQVTSLPELYKVFERC